MFKYVLIIWIHSMHGVSITTHEFLSAAACDKAGKLAASRNSTLGPSVYYSCSLNDTVEGK